MGKELQAKELIMEKVLLRRAQTSGLAGSGRMDLGLDGIWP